jgi:hypothetical protein
MAFDSDAIRRISHLVSGWRLRLFRGSAGGRVEAGDHCIQVSKIAVAQRGGCKWLSFRVVNVIIELYRYSSDTCAL